MGLIDDSIEHAEGYLIMEYLAVKSLIGKIKGHYVSNVHFTFIICLWKSLLCEYILSWMMTFQFTFEPLFKVQGKADKNPFFIFYYNVKIIIT